MEQNNIPTEDFNEKFLESYRQEQSDPTDKGHQFDSQTSVAEGQVMNPATNGIPLPTEQTVQSAVTEAVVTVFGQPVVDYVNDMVPNGVPAGSRHKTALRLAYDLLLVCDGDAEKARQVLLLQPWVKAIVTERGMKELDDIMDAAQKLKHKRESENYFELQPSREMRRAIERVTGRRYTTLVTEAHRQLMNMAGGEQDNVTAMLERIGCEIEKLFPRFPLLKLLCHRLERKYYVVALFVGGAYAMLGRRQAHRCETLRTDDDPDKEVRRSPAGSHQPLERGA